MVRTLLITASVILLLCFGLFIWILEPWVPAALRKDVSTNAGAFLVAAEELRKQADGASYDLEASPDTFQDLSRLGYYRIKNCRGTILFYRYRRFRAIGTTGVAQSPPGHNPSCMEWDLFYPLSGDFYRWDQK